MAITRGEAAASTDPIGRIEYETRDGTRTGRWRPREGADRLSGTVGRGRLHGSPERPWRVTKAPGEPGER